MNQVRNTERLNQRELEAGISIEASWHNEYNDTAYIFFGSLPYELTEGDILIIFSQYGIPVHLKLVRDKETGKSKGFGYLKYEDQRSTILAVDNLNGTKVLGRIIRVDHAYYEERDYDEEYEQMLQEELKNDFAETNEDGGREEIPAENQDDEIQDPLLLMQKKTSDKSKHRSRRRDHEHTHRSRDKKHRDRSSNGAKDDEFKKDSHRTHRDKGASSSSRREHRDNIEHHHSNDRHHEGSHRKHRTNDRDDAERSEKRPRKSDDYKLRDDELTRGYESTEKNDHERTCIH